MVFGQKVYFVTAHHPVPDEHPESLQHHCSRSYRASNNVPVVETSFVWEVFNENFKSAPNRKF